MVYLLELSTQIPFLFMFFCKHHAVVFFRLIISTDFIYFSCKAKTLRLKQSSSLFFSFVHIFAEVHQRKVELFFAPICREFRKFRRKKPQQNEQHEFMMDHRSYTHRLSQSPRFSQSPRSLGPFSTSFARYHLHGVDLEQVYYIHNFSI